MKDARDHAALLDLLLPALVSASEVLLHHRMVGTAVEQKGDGSPVTAADREAEAILLEALAQAAPGVPVLAEEAQSAGACPQLGSRVFLVDPLDGTREFIAGSDQFTVNIGLVEDGRPVFGVVVAPALGQIFATLGTDRAIEAQLVLGRVPQSLAEFAPREIGTAEPDASAFRVLASRSHYSPQLDEFVAAYPAARIRRAGSSVKFCLIARGEADAYPRFGPTCVWDTCAGQAVLNAAGGTVTTVSGAVLDYNTLGTTLVNPGFIAWGRPRVAELYHSARA